VTPRVSVIVPTVARPELLAASVASALGQTVKDIEVLVVNDGGDLARDGTPAGEPRVQHLWQTNQGAAAARNFGAARARGEWLAFLDDDDLWLPGKLERQLALAQHAPDAGMIHTDFLVLENDRTRLGDRVLPRERIPSGWVGRELFLENFVLTSSVLMRRDLFARLGGFDTGLRRIEDYELWLRAARQAPIGFVPEALTVYRAHVGQKSNNEMEKHLLLPVIFERFVRHHPEVWQAYGAAAVRRRLNRLRWRAGYANWLAGSYGTARVQFLMAWRWQPRNIRPLLYALACGGGPQAVQLGQTLKRALSRAG